MKSLRIVFMGTPDFAVSILDRMIKAKHQIVGVITAPDKPAGRGRKIHQSAVKTYTLETSIPILQPTNLKSDVFYQELQALQPDVIVVVAFRMLPKRIWSLPPLGTFNLHASLLPQYRGAAPINWAIINGETQTGVTTFFLDEKIDTGAILLQKKTSIDPHESAGDLHDRLMLLGAETVLETLELIAKDRAKPVQQSKSEDLKTAHKFNAENTKIDWQQPAEQIYNFIRGLSPFPVAYTFLTNNEEEKLRLKVFKAKVTDLPSKRPPGTLFKENNRLLVSTQTQSIEIIGLQLQGKRKMNAIDFLNGFNLDKEIQLS